MLRSVDGESCMLLLRVKARNASGKHTVQLLLLSAERSEARYEGSGRLLILHRCRSMHRRSCFAEKWPADRAKYEVVSALHRSCLERRRACAAASVHCGLTFALQ